jgi:hypothetical protein
MAERLGQHNKDRQKLGEVAVVKQLGHPSLIAGRNIDMVPACDLQKRARRDAPLKVEVQLHFWHPHNKLIKLH